MNFCLTVGPEDYVHGKCDQTAKALLEICSIIGFSYKDIYMINSLLCWQGTNSSGWKSCWEPCLTEGWLQRAIEMCAPRLIVSFGTKALRAVNHLLGGPSGEPNMGENMDRPRILKGIHIWPLAHPAATRTYPLPRQRKGWYELRTYMDSKGMGDRNGDAAS